MPVELLDDDGNAIDLEKADGGTLRKKLEEALRDNRRLAQDIVAAKAESVVGEHGMGLVKPDDVKGVPADQLEAKVKELAEAKLAERKNVIRDVLAARDGLEGDDLDAAVDEFVSGGEGEGTGEPDLSSLANLGGERPKPSPKLPPIEDAFSNLESHFTTTGRGRKK